MYVLSMCNYTRYWWWIHLKHFNLHKFNLSAEEEVYISSIILYWQGTHTFKLYKYIYKKSPIKIKLTYVYFVVIQLYHLYPLSFVIKLWLFHGHPLKFSIIPYWLVSLCIFLIWYLLPQPNENSVKSCFMICTL